jgi:uncharacterized protein (TIGR02301 family)
MVDVFISYKREQRERVALIASRLEAVGLSVWYDASLNSGEAFDRQIQRELSTARCVLVLWSPAALQSDYVRGEALSGHSRGVLACAQIERVDLRHSPPFNLIQASDLSRWAGDEAHPEWRAVLRTIGRLTGRPDLAAAPSQPLPPPSPAPQSGAMRKRLAVAGGGLFIVLLGIFAVQAMANNRPPEEAAPPIVKETEAPADTAAFPPVEAAPETTPADVVPAEVPQIEKISQGDLVAMSGYIGGIQYVAILCNGRGDQRWRDHMIKFMEHFAPKGSSSRAALTNEYNASYRDMEKLHSACSEAAKDQTRTKLTIVSNTAQTMGLQNISDADRAVLAKLEAAARLERVSTWPIATPTP